MRELRTTFPPWKAATDRSQTDFGPESSITNRTVTPCKADRAALTCSDASIT